MSFADFRSHPISTHLEALPLQTVYGYLEKKLKIPLKQTLFFFLTPNLCVTAFVQTKVRTH